MTIITANQAEDAALKAREPRIPPRTINYNQAPSGNLDEYILDFKTSSCTRELPFLMNRAGLTPDSVLFDYGCGLGRLAYPASHYLSEQGAYYGYEINQEAIDFLKNAYGDLPNFFFGGDLLRLQDDYIGVATKRSDTSEVDPVSIDIAGFLHRPVDVQWSLSVFTHMWQAPIVRTLREIKTSLAPGGLCVNTWLIIDDFAAYTLRCGMADRRLPYKIDGAWTYLRDNPLMCTAYELPDVKSMYAQAGHEIIDILYGSWSGRCNPATYIDVVISRPID